MADRMVMASCAWGLLGALLAGTIDAALGNPDNTEAGTKPGTSREDAVDALFAELRCPDTPGAAVGIYRSGKVVYVRGYGCADIEHAVPVTPQTLSDAASVSKQFTAFSAALLAGEGRLDLDRDVRAFLPAVPEFDAPINVRQLIHHTSGLRDDPTIFELAGRGGQHVTQQDVLNMVSRQQSLNFVPGSEYLYSNTGYSLLAEIIAKVSGRSFRQFTSETVFAPLGMAHSFLADDPQEIIGGRAHSYERSADGKRWLRSADASGVVGSTGLQTNVEDMLRWARNFTSHAVGGAALIQGLGEPGRLNGGELINYRFGLERYEYAGRPALAHAGSTAGFTTLFTYFPAQDFAVVLLMNAEGELDARVDAIVDLYLGRIPREAQKRKDSADVANGLVGHYVGDYTPMASIYRVGAQLVWQWPGGAPHSLQFRNDGNFDLGQPRYDYYRPVRDRRGSVVGIEEVTVGTQQRPVVFHRAEPAVPTGAELDEIAGDYRSDELDVTYRLTVERGCLVARTSWMREPVVFTPSVKDRFDSPWWGMYSVAFERDAQRRVTGLQVNSDRIRHVRLIRVPALPATQDLSGIASVPEVRQYHGSR